MLNLPVQTKNNVQVMSSVDLAKLCVGDTKDAHSDFLNKAKKVIGVGVGNFSDTYLSKQGKTLKCLMLPEREACLMAMSYSYELQAHVFDEWQKLKNQKQVSLPSTKQLALMVIQAEEEKEKALLLVEKKSQHIESLESLFYNGGTIAQFVKQLNGVNSQKVTTWINDNTKWLYDENKGKINKHGMPKPYSWRCASYARDKYLTESTLGISPQGMNEFTRYEVKLLADGKRWIFDKYVSGKLPMKADWNGKYTHKKDLS